MMSATGPLVVPARSPELLQAVEQLGAAAKGRQGQAAERESFADVLRNLVQPVVDAGNDVDHELGRLLSGEAQDLHQLQVAMAKSELTWNLMMQIRNKAMQAYHEIMQMQV